MSGDKKVETFKGIVTIPFSIASVKKGDKPKDYVLGDKFETKNEALYNSLIEKKRIKR